MINDSIRVTRRPRRASPRTARSTVAIIATAGLALLTAACGGSPSSTGPGGSSNAGGSTNSRQLAFARCMRSHGVPNFPDPNSSGGFPNTTLRQLAASNSHYQAATHACGHLLPNGGGKSLSASLRQCEETGDCPRAMVQQVMTQLRKFARCMRSHGVPNWPDPTLDSQGQPKFFIRPWKVGFDPNSPQISNKMFGCQHVEHPQVPAPMAVYLRPNGQGG